METCEGLLLLLEQSLPLHLLLPSTPGFSHIGFREENFFVNFDEQVDSHSEILENLERKINNIFKFKV